MTVVDRFVQGIDYGTRKGTLGFAIHMAEGGDGTVAYLARRQGETLSAWKNRVRGVSANFVVESTGRVTQMVPWENASGSMNPSNDGPTGTGFYRQAIVDDVLGDHEDDPNAYSLSVEITGFRAQGPTDAQVDAVIELVAEAREKFPLMRGAYGHHDQTSTKGCPGLSANMMRIWTAVGHGLFPKEAHDMAISTGGLTLVSHHAINLPTDTKVYEFPEAGSPVIGTFTGRVPYFGSSNGYKAVRVDPPGAATTVIGYTKTAASVVPNPPPVPPPDPAVLKAEFNKGVTAASAAAKTATKP